MAHARASHGVGGGAKIADFWRFSAVFDPIGRGPLPIITASASGAITGNHGQPVDGSLPAADAICPPDRGCRLPDHGQRFAVRYVWGMDHGAWRGWFNSFNAATSAS